MPFFRPAQGEIDRLVKESRAISGDSRQLQDNHLYALLFNKQRGLFADHADQKAEWIGGQRFQRRLRRREWIERYFRIRDAEGKIVPLLANPSQRRLEALVIQLERLGRPVRIQILKARKQGFCLDAQTRVLTADLRWVKLDDVRVGDRLVGCDEGIPGGRGASRKMRVTTVTAKRESIQDAFRVVFDGGEITATGNHRLLWRRSQKQWVWRRVSKMTPGDRLRPISAPWGQPDVDDGWFGGIIDGEGHLRSKTGKTALTVTQNEGCVLRRAESYLEGRGYHYGMVRPSGAIGRFGPKNAWSLCVYRTDELLRLIGTTRPERYTGATWWAGRDFPGKRSGVCGGTITSIEPVGRRRMLDIQTTTGTFVAEGIVSHNSTFVQAMMFERALRTERFNGIIIAHNKDTAKKLIAMAHVAKNEMVKQTGPPLVRWNFLMRSEARGTLVWDDPINAELYVESAETKDPGRGGTPSMVHLCLDMETPVLIADGREVPAYLVKPGDRVLTHTGKSAMVTAVSVSVPSESNGGGDAVRIRPWLSSPITVTPNHPVFTQRGWVRADGLRKTDVVAMPIRAITSELPSLTLPSWTTKQIGRRGCRSIGMGKELPLSEDVGFFFGYYLAEGSLCRNPGGPSAVSFARHRNEKPYADRATAAVRGFVRSRKTVDRNPTLTSVDTVYGSALARLVEREFGFADTKHVPDWVFTAGVPFVRGLLAGYLCGDGSKTANKSGGGHDSPMVAATSIRSSLTMQMRDIAASLGYGWGSVAFREGGLRFGRNERPAWTVIWSGSAARSLRALMGLSVPRAKQGWSEKAILWGGMVWLPIRLIEPAKTSMVVDIEVDHPDHSFRTRSFVVKNSETAFYPDAARAQTAVMASLPTIPGTYAFDESTANGDQGKFRDDFWDAWRDRDIPLRERVNVWNALFFAWWEHDGYRYSKTYGAGQPPPEKLYESIRTGLDAEESWLLRQKYFRRFDGTEEWERVQRKLVHEYQRVATRGRHVWRGTQPEDCWVWRRKGVGLRSVDIDQLAWRRTKITDKEIGGDLQKFNQEYPSRPEVAFASSGRPVFDPDRVSKKLREMRDIKPVFRGSLRTSAWTLEGLMPQAVRESQDEDAESGASDPA